MAIYGDGKHNENMEHNAPKYVVTDKVVYKTTHWTIETEDETYFIQCQEGDMYDTWFIDSNEGNIDTNTKLGQELIETCEKYKDWNITHFIMDSDEKFDDGGWGDMERGQNK